MAQPSQIQGDFLFYGNLQFASVILPSGSVKDSNVQAGAGIQTSKLMHRYKLLYKNGGDGTGFETRNVATDQQPIFLCDYSAIGTNATVSFLAGSVVAATSTGTATIQLLKNGVDISGGGVVLTSANTAWQKVAAVISDTTLAPGDRLEIKVLSVSGANLPQGVFAELIVDESPS